MVSHIDCDVDDPVGIQRDWLGARSDGHIAPIDRCVHGHRLVLGMRGWRANEDCRGREDHEGDDATRPPPHVPSFAQLPAIRSDCRISSIHMP
jgi:hypothetical protein